MSQPVRVLELRSVRGTGGGPEKTILLGAQQADRSRFAVTVCYIRDARDAVFGIDARAERLGIDYVEIPERSSFDPRVWGALRRLVRDRGIDIVHAHEYKTDLLALWLARTEGIVPLATSHGWSGHSVRERLVYYPADKRLLRAFPLTIAVSGQIRSELVNAGVPADRVRVVLNAIDHRAFRRDRSREARARLDLALSPDDVVIGAIGSLEACKRFDLLIRTCAELRSRWPTLRLLIAGDGSLSEDLRALAARLLPAGVCQLLGHRPDVVALHHAFDVFVQSSDHEGTPNVVLEAMALETPIVATAAGGTGEIVENGVHALVVPPGDACALANAIDRTLSHRGEAAARVGRARRHVETRLSFDARMDAVESVYDELVNRCPRRGADRTADRCA
jgi:glycosyltransferase involved in cell wall biosynthesis